MERVVRLEDTEVGVLLDLEEDLEERLLGEEKEAETRRDGVRGVDRGDSGVMVGTVKRPKEEKYRDKRWSCPFGRQSRSWSWSRSDLPGFYAQLYDTV
ncbi:hypothetical protein GH714_012426 [Hevea brasiliensis]|uniref:Uncharacterized protein n=1 Tax=Hevea brasiliensis TaxID=3981 RepID=A0A6A6LYK9_HEVBR|nr:hypothetical protein GH714_012426 [Hevea brasiliensis]